MFLCECFLSDPSGGECLLEGLDGEVAALDQPLISLKACVMSSKVSQEAAAPASQIVRGPQAARRMEELAGTPSGALMALGLNGSFRERTCQAAMSTLRATAAFAGVVFPWRFRMFV
jgi:hypothetical protein